MVKVCFILFLIFCPTVFAWNALGHRVITQIAYDKLTPHAKSRFNAYNRLLNKKGRSSYSFVEASVWLDKIRYFSDDLPKEIHYIDIPFSTDPSLSLPEVGHVNALTALTKAEKTLSDKHSTARARAVALRTLIHLIEDIHQPLHTATRVSKVYPLGDKGGNLVILPRNALAPNLHAYWDKGISLFLIPMDAKQIKRYASAIAMRRPCIQEDQFNNFKDWAQSSHQLAVQEAYQFSTEEDVLNSSHQQRALSIAESQAALAGCRLAALLNEIDKK